MPLTRAASATAVSLAVALLASSAHAQSCSAKFSTSNSWQSSGKTYYSLTADVSNTGTQTISVPWTLTLINNAYAGVQQVRGHRL